MTEATGGWVGRGRETRLPLLLITLGGHSIREEVNPSGQGAV